MQDGLCLASNCTAGGMWHFRGFAPERRQEKDNEIQENLLSKLVREMIYK